MTEPMIPDAERDARFSAETNGAHAAGGPVPLVEPGALSTLTDRWRDIQAEFVDRPQEAVRSADSLVRELMDQLATTFADERQQLEQQWSHGDQVSTEELRVSLTRYRSFFQRLLSV